MRKVRHHSGALNEGIIIDNRERTFCMEADFIGVF